jgi:hypothetical protein
MREKCATDILKTKARADRRRRLAIMPVNVGVQPDKNIYMKTYSMIALFILSISVNISGQRSGPASKWEISFGSSWGRFHQHSEKHTVDSDGSITYLNERNGTPVIGQISGRDVDEITGLLTRLNLHRAKSIPSNEFNKCVVSPHAPISYFSLAHSGKEYRLSPCKVYGYTLILSVGQRAVYKRLRAKLESLFAEQIAKDARQRSIGPGRLA